MYQNVLEKPGVSEITSSITDLRYKWPFSFTTRAVVSFKLNIEGIRDGQTLVSHVFEVKNFKGSKGSSLRVPVWYPAKCGNSALTLTRGAMNGTLRPCFSHRDGVLCFTCIL